MPSSAPAILVIEDEAQLRAYLVEVLKSEGFEVLESADATVAFQVLESSKTLSLVLTDVKIPGYVSGTMFAHVVTEYRPSIPMIVMSGYAEPRRGELPPHAVFLPKPFTSAQLLELISRQLSAA